MGDSYNITHDVNIPKIGLTEYRGFINGNQIKFPSKKDKFQYRISNPEFSTNPGLIDGNGLTNGNGLSIVKMQQKNRNHKRLTTKEGQKQKRIEYFKYKQRKERLLVIIISLLIFILPLNLYLWDFNVKDNNLILIDGQFGDWDNHMIHLDDNFDVENNANIDIIKYGLTKDLNNFYFYLEFYGTCLKGYKYHHADTEITCFDAIQIFLDTDNNKDTGYEIRSIGADYLIEAKGNNNMIYITSNFEFDNSKEWYDWNGWKPSSFHYSTGLKDKRFEAQVPIDSLSCSGSDILALFCAKDSADNIDFSDSVITPSNNILRINQIDNGSSILSRDKGDGILSKILFSPENVDTQINCIRLNYIGTVSEQNIDRLTLVYRDNEISEGLVENGEIELEFKEPLILSKNVPVTIELKAELSANFQTQSVVGFELVSVDARNRDNTQKIPSSIVGKPNLMYINELPEKIIIDGAFDDWRNVPIEYDKDSEPITNLNVDLSEYQVKSSKSELSFCFGVSGRVLEGTYSPTKSEYKFIRTNQNQMDELNSKSEECNDILFDVKERLPELSGLDTAHIFLDIDNDPTSGYRNSNWDIGADYMLEISGKNGRIINNQFFKFVGAHSSQWIWLKIGRMPVGLNTDHLETQIQVSMLGDINLEKVKIMFHISDWSANPDDIMEDYSNTIDKRIYEKNYDINENIIYDQPVTEISETEESIVKTNSMDSITPLDSIGSSTRCRGLPVELKSVAEGIGTENNDGFGWNVSDAGDINNDGYSDILVGAPFNDSISQNSGAVYLFLGYPSIDINNLNAEMANVSIFGNNSGSLLGWSLDYVGDIDNDNVDDIVIGSPGFKNGTAYLIYGNNILQAVAKDESIDVSTQANVTLSGSEVGELFGYSVSGAGDINFDGFDDLVIGAPGYNNQQGAAYIFYGNDTLTDQWANNSNASIYGENAGDLFGSSVTSAGDVNNDSYLDILIGAPGFESNKGRSYLYFGSSELSGWSENLNIYHWEEADGAVINPPGYGIYKNQFLAQSFTAVENYRLTKVAMYICAIGLTPGNLVISLQGDNSGPDGTILTNCSAISSGPTSVTWVELEFNEPYQLKNGTKYWIVAAGDGKNTLNCWEWLEDENVGTNCPGGSGAYSGGAGKPWTVEPATSDYLIKIYGQVYTGLDANVILEGEHAGDLFGFSVSSAGNIGQDDFDDIIIGAPGSGSNNGTVYLINGSMKLNNTISNTGIWGVEKLFNNWEHGGDLELVIYNDSVGNSQSLAQSFVPTEDFNLTRVSLFIEAIGTPGSLSIKLMGSIGTSPNTKPDNNILTQAPSISTGSKSYSWVNFTFTSPYYVKSGIEYFIVAEGTGSNTANCWVWYTQSVGSYSQGDYAFNQGSSWTASNRDCYFKVFGKTGIQRPNVTIEGRSGDMLGWSVCSANDMNNNGFSDIIIGAPGNDSKFGNLNDAGSIYVFNGITLKQTMDISDADNVSYGESANDHFGWSVAGIHDIDNNGFNDVLVGAPHYDNGTDTDTGKAFVLSSKIGSNIPEYNILLLPIMLLLVLISIIRKKYFIIYNRRGVKH